MNSPEFDFQIYQDVSAQLEGRHILNALQDLVQGADGEHGTVPLVPESVRESLLNTEYDTVEGLVIVGVDAATHTLGMGVVAPSGMEENSFIEMCRELNQPLQRPIRLRMNEVFAGLSENSSMVTGVSYISGSESGRGMTALHVPAYYMNEGYDLAHELNREDPVLGVLDRQEMSTQISSALFDHFTGIHLEHS